MRSKTVKRLRRAAREAGRSEAETKALVRKMKKAERTGKPVRVWLD